MADPGTPAAFDHGLWLHADSWAPDRPVSRATVRRYRRSEAVTGCREFPDRRHSFTVDRGRREVADEVLARLAERSLGDDLAPSVAPGL